MTATLPDILKKNLSVIFCGINPGSTAAAAGSHFYNRSNRFWRVLHRAGFTPVQIPPEQDRTILKYGYGLTVAVTRATKRASDLSRDELTQSATALRQKIERYRPRVLAFLGKAAYAAISGTREVTWGAQDAKFGGAAVWVLPNPSGLNRSFQLDDLVAAYGELYRSLPDRPTNGDGDGARCARPRMRGSA